MNMTATFTGTEKYLPAAATTNDYSKVSFTDGNGNTFSEEVWQIDNTQANTIDFFALASDNPQCNHDQITAADNTLPNCTQWNSIGGGVFTLDCKVTIAAGVINTVHYTVYLDANNLPIKSNITSLINGAVDDIAVVSYSVTGAPTAAEFTLPAACNGVKLLSRRGFRKLSFVKPKEGL